MMPLQNAATHLIFYKLTLKPCDESRVDITPIL